MRKCVLQIVSLCMALFIAYAGGGLNIYHYCCDACEEYQCSMHNVQCTIVDALEHECCTHQHADDGVIATNDIQFTNEAEKCGVTRVEALDLWKFSSEKEGLVILPWVATLTSIHNSQFIIHNYDQGKVDYDVPIALNLSGRAIIVRKSAYLI